MGTDKQARCWVSSQPGLDALSLEQCPPPSPRDDQLLIDVHAAALNFSDLLMIDDKYQIKPPRPFIPGQEIAGTVIAAGPSCHYKVGERVAGKVDWGGFSSQALLRDDMAISLPADCPFFQGAALPVVYTTAYVALTESTQVRAGETVLVHAAAGGIGLAAVQIAAAAGATVIACAGSHEKRALALANGAAHALDYTQPGWPAACKELTGGRGVDIVVDPVGGEVTVESLRAMALHARLLIVGFASGEIPNIPASRLLLKRISAIGVYWNHDADADMLRRVTARMTAGLADAAISPLVDLRQGLDALPTALQDLQSRRTSGKIVLDLKADGKHG